ncbi:MAG: MFS transporter [Acidobacteria bacterium]|nr:MFS transporter [Acidobacteriota bacterium]
MKADAAVAGALTAVARAASVVPAWRATRVDPVIALKSEQLTERLFTPRFFVMCGFTFTVFLSAFQLLPTAPFHILALGGSTFASGLFLGFLTYSSALSAPATGALADRIGARRILLTSSLALVVFSIAYAVIPSYRVALALVLIHGVFWSGLLSASAAYLTNMLPEKRRAEGIAYWGLSSIAAIAVAPPIGFWVFRRGWAALCLESAALNLVMAAIAWRLPPQAPHAPSAAPRRFGVEWRVLLISLTLFMYSFGYGGITSFAALYADANRVAPKGIYLTSLAVVMLVTRPFSGRLGDRFGYRRVFLPCLILISAGLACLTIGGTRQWLVTSAVLFGIGFGTAYPSYVGYVMRHVGVDRRGAAFGAILAAFDTGIGTGSTTMGWIIGKYGFASAFGTAAALSALALPYFLFADRMFTRIPDQGGRTGYSRARVERLLERDDGHVRASGGDD